MKSRPFALFVRLALAVLLVATGVGTAKRMTPDPADLALAAFVLAHGDTNPDLCGNDRAHAPHCPFCHGLPGAPEIRPSGLATLLVPQDGWVQLHDLERAAQARNSNHSPRAPPHLV